MSNRFSESSIPVLNGKTAIVTGANSGLGFEISRALANHGARVIMACRDEVKGAEATHRIHSANPEADILVKNLDLSSLKSIDQFSKEVLESESHIDLLINNAGLMAINENKTVEGFEMQFGVNHLGHFALTANLISRLMQSPESRIVSMSSAAHRNGKMNFDDLMYVNHKYSRWGAYSQSKLAILLFTAELNRRLEGRSTTLALTAHPGVAKTKLGQNGGGIIGIGFQLSAPLIAHSALKGALPALRAATDPDVHGGEFYGPRYGMFGTPVVEQPSARAQNMNDAAELWRISEKLTKKSFPI